MNKFLLITLMLSTGACSTLTQRVYEKISDGDSAQKVTKEFGKPDSYERSEKVPGAVAWVYTSKGDECFFRILEDKVHSFECRRDPNYISFQQRMSVGMQAFGQSMQQSSQQPSYQQSYQPPAMDLSSHSYSNPIVNCTTTPYGFGGATTTCN